MRVLAWLREHRSTIVDTEQKYRVDRRAIAGLIAWEALMNIHGKMTEVFGRGVGPGKAHVWDIELQFVVGTPLDPAPGIIAVPTHNTLVKQIEDANWLPKSEQMPKHTYEESKQLLNTPEGAITYMGAAMNAAARLAENAGFSSIPPKT